MAPDAVGSGRTRQTEDKHTDARSSSTNEGGDQRRRKAHYVCTPSARVLAYVVLQQPWQRIQIRKVRQRAVARGEEGQQQSNRRGAVTAHTPKSGGRRKNRRGGNNSFGSRGREGRRKKEKRKEADREKIRSMFFFFSFHTHCTTVIQSNTTAGVSFFSWHLRSSVRQSVPHPDFCERFLQFFQKPHTFVP